MEYVGGEVLEPLSLEIIKKRKKERINFFLWNSN